jgi:hypothetical protein
MWETFFGFKKTPFADNLGDVGNWPKSLVPMPEGIFQCAI